MYRLILANSPSSRVLTSCASVSTFVIQPASFSKVVWTSAHHIVIKIPSAVIEDGYPDDRLASSLPLPSGLSYGSSPIRSTVRQALPQTAKGAPSEDLPYTTSEGREFPVLPPSYPLTFESAGSHPSALKIEPKFRNVSPFQTASSDPSVAAAVAALSERLGRLMDASSARVAAAVTAHAARLAAAERRVRSVRACMTAARSRSGPGLGLVPAGACEADGPAAKTVRREVVAGRARVGGLSTRWWDESPPR